MKKEQLLISRSDEIRQNGRKLLCGSSLVNCCLAWEFSEQHHIDGEIAPGWKLRVLLAQALFAVGHSPARQTDQPSLSIGTVVAGTGAGERSLRPVIISHDRHFATWLYPGGSGL